MITLHYKVDLPLQNDYPLLLFSLELTVNPVVLTVTQLTLEGQIVSLLIWACLYSGIELCWHRK